MSREIDPTAGPPPEDARPKHGFVIRVISIVVFVLTLEGSIRVGDWLRFGAPLQGPYSHDGLFTADSLGWHPKPGARFQKWTINELGFRGPEITRDPRPGVTRVVVLGSSETFGQSESPDHEFPRVLEDVLNQTATGRFEVINAGIPGMSIARMTEYWQRWVRRFHPDVVVVYPSPSFYLNNDPPPDASTSSFTPPVPDPPALRLLPNLRQTLDRVLPATIQSAVRERQTKRLASSQPDDWVWRVVPQDRLHLYTRHLRELVTHLQSAGVRVVLATHANAIERPLDDAERRLMVAWRRFSPRAEANVILDFEVRANEALVALAAETGSAVVRLDEAVPPELGLFSDNEHFTDAGAAQAAEALAVGVLEAESGGGGATGSGA